MPTVRDLVRAADRGPVLATGATAAYAAYLGAALAATRPVIAVVASDAAARALVEDLALWGVTATVLPEPDGSAYAELAADRAAEAARLAVLYALARGGADAPRVIVTTGAALLRKTMPAAELVARGLAVVPGTSLPRDATAARLLEAGFARAPVVDDVGTFAVRGNVIDVGAPGLPYPVRLELDGDDVDSIRLFDPQSQRTLRTIERLDLHPIRTAVPTSSHDWKSALRELADEQQHPSSATRRLIEQLASGDAIGADVYAPAFHAALVPVASYLPDAAAWLWWDPDATVSAIDGDLMAATAGFAERRAHKQLAFAPDAHFVERAAFVAAIATGPRRVVLPALALVDDPRGRGADVVAVQLDPLAALRTQLERARVQHDDHLGDPLVRAIASARRDGCAVVLAADSAARADRLHGLLEGHGLAADRVEQVTRTPDRDDPVQIAVAPLSGSFLSAADGLLVITAADVFGVKRHAPRNKSAAKRAKDALLGGVGDFAQLAPGDFLVHQLHGVGRYRGLAKLPLGGTAIDFLQLEYDGGTLYLPVFRLGEVQRYVGAEGHGPRLDKLGGVTWDKAKGKVSRQVAALAEELLQVYAQRATLPGHRFPPPDEMYGEFEAAFPYEETPDQLAAIEATMADMESAKAMDRLVCGDVGYGKTEVALRAIMKCALAGKQALLLAPTTILVEQHARTMTERFASWPVRVGKLSRFQTKTEQLATLRALGDGALDVVVGTHRALSPDVRWKDLGLVVIDEEQRFGVTHKERLKKLRAHVDVLTLTATPIPRTLHLALTGMRDLSIIATPPADRRAVRTFVAQVDNALIKSAIETELQRGGQIYFVTRRIEGGGAGVNEPTAARNDLSLEQWAKLLAQLVPTARIGKAHGGLSAEALEDVMVAFVKGDLDVLVATTIVESGLDIPRANTLFVARADAFGLSQLYQLRGRVGRSSARAYCYLLVPPPEQLTDEARRRLEALQRFTELGAGFQIASADLEIRGGGELLGARQSGSIAAVGFDQYVRMLEEAVAALRGEPIHHPVDPELTVDMPGYIPDDYVPDPGQRLDLYKRLSAIEDEDECRALLDELADRFGPLPGETLLLADLMVVKALARRLDATSVELTKHRLAIALGASTPVDATKLPRGWRLDRDGRLHTLFDAEAAKAPPQAARRRLQELGLQAVASRGT